MRKRRERQKRRFGNAGVQLAALGVAVSVFGVSAVLGADMLADTAVYAAADPYEGITQEGELGIAQVLAEESGFDLDEGIAVSEESAENADSSAEESSPLSSQEEQADVLSSRQPKCRKAACRLLSRLPLDRRLRSRPLPLLTAIWKTKI